MLLIRGFVLAFAMSVDVIGKDAHRFLILRFDFRSTQRSFVLPLIRSWVLALLFILRVRTVLLLGDLLTTNWVDCFRRLFNEVFEHFDRLTWLTDLDKWSQIYRIFLELDHVIWSIHIHEHIFLLELDIVVLRGIVIERCLGSTEVAAKNQELIAFIRIRTHWIK
jgi:hypothetical protein